MTETNASSPTGEERVIVVEDTEPSETKNQYPGYNNDMREEWKLQDASFEVIRRKIEALGQQKGIIMQRSCNYFKNDLSRTKVVKNCRFFCKGKQKCSG